MAKDFIPPAALRQVSQDVKYLAEYLDWKKAPDLLYVTVMETLKPSPSQFVSSGHKMLVDEVTQSASSKAVC